MIIGIGVDLLHTDEVLRELARGPWLKDDGVFTPAEIAWCSAGRRPERRFAACFSTKEATLKALGAEVADLRFLRELEVKFDKGLAREIVLHGRMRDIADRLGVRHINLSTAITSKRIAAMVLMES
ncbi:MAG: holo-ACP synthase [Terracidiphilus sp.]